MPSNVFKSNRFVEASCSVFCSACGWISSIGVLPKSMRYGNSQVELYLNSIALRGKLPHRALELRGCVKVQVMVVMQSYGLTWLS